MLNHLNNEQFYSQLAGFIDGEGCVYISKSKNDKISWGFQYSLKLEITQANKKLLEAIKNRIGFGSNVHNKSILKNRKPETWSEVYSLKWSSNQAYEVIKKVYPYLVIKQKQAKLATEFQELVRGNYGKKANRIEEYSDKQFIFYNDLKKMKLEYLNQAP